MRDGYKRCSRCKKAKRMDSFNRHARTKDGRQAYCKPCTTEYARELYWRRYDENKEKRRLGRLKAHQQRAVARRAAAEEQAASVDPALGSWLAGLTDGEGCFTIRRQHKRPDYICEFAIQMREDERPLFTELTAVLGIGALHTWASAGHCRMVRWNVAAKDEALFLAALFQLYPLKTNKRIDFGFWRQAVLLWTAMPRIKYEWGSGQEMRDWRPIALLREQLMASRAARSAAAR
jgi:LAGLIDADG endonuclease